MKNAHVRDVRVIDLLVVKVKTTSDHWPTHKSGDLILQLSVMAIHNVSHIAYPINPIDGCPRHSKSMAKAAIV